MMRMSPGQRTCLRCPSHSRLGTLPSGMRGPHRTGVPATLGGLGLQFTYTGVSEKSMNESPEFRDLHVNCSVLPHHVMTTGYDVYMIVAYVGIVLLRFGCMLVARESADAALYLQTNTD